MSKSSQEGTLSDWDQLLAAVEANQEDLPHVGGLRAQLAERVAGIRTLQTERDLLRMELQGTTPRLQQALAKGRDLASRLRAFVRSTYGIHSDKLIEFGIKPLGRKKWPEGRLPTYRGSE
ncbi:MAG: hypothetical protein ACJ76N_19565 [Thermoanaerobaculia bacterium]